MRVAVYLLGAVALVSAAAALDDIYLSEDTSDNVSLNEDTSDSVLLNEYTSDNRKNLLPYLQNSQDEMPEDATLRKGCKTGKACKKSKGSCISSSETCSGKVVNKGCGANCTCCVKEAEKCEAKGVCKVAGGYCALGAGSCSGSIIQDGCTGKKNGKKCVCCLNDNNCPKGFHRVGTECFKVYQEFAAWDEARQICKDDGWELAEPEDLTALAQYIYSEISHSYVWIGGRAVGGYFKYRSGGTLQGTKPWAQGYPGDRTDLDYCLIIRSSYPSNTTALASFDCLGKYNFLCEPACPEGFIRSGSGCFQVEAINSNWDTAERNCYEKGLQIAEPEDPQGLAKMLYDGVGGTRYTSTSFHIGARGGRIDGNTIAWNSGEAVPIPYPIAGTWHASYPRRKTSGYCLMIYTGYPSSGAMYESSCNSAIHNICEWKCPLGFFRIGKRCFKAFSSSATSWTRARETCLSEGLTLAEPVDPSAVGDYLFTVTGNNNYWLGGRGDGNRLRWSSGEAIPNNWALWRPGNPGSKVGTNYCLRLAPEFRNTPLTSTACSTTLYPLCQKYTTFES